MDNIPVKQSNHTDAQALLAQRCRSTLAELRLQITYILFDLEATKRENEQLRRMLAEETDR